MPQYLTVSVYDTARSKLATREEPDENAASQADLGPSHRFSHVAACHNLNPNQNHNLILNPNPNADPDPILPSLILGLKLNSLVSISLLIPMPTPMVSVSSVSQISST